MPTYEIPGRDVIKAENIYILTADTYGTVETECRELNATVRTFPTDIVVWSITEGLEIMLHPNAVITTSRN